jgi:hypothetical protein
MTDAAAEGLSWLDAAGERFEQAWDRGERPRLEALLEGVPEPRQSVLLGHLLGIELERRSKAGERPTPEEYRQRFPAHTALIKAKFGEARDRASESNGSHRLALTGPYAPAAEDAEQPVRLGRYSVVATLGRGSFGVVYQGYDEELRRDVAIKVPHRERIAELADVEAYLAEARILASLDQPHIVPVYDVGRTEDGLCYVVSKFIPGSDLARRIKEAPPSALEAAELVAVVAEALHYAHRRRLVHRDIKPANILLDHDGQPQITDFGQASRTAGLWQLFRGRPGRSGCLCPAAHHPRLGRGKVPGDPPPLPAGDVVRKPIARHRECHSTGERAVPRQVPRSAHAADPWRQGSNRERVPDLLERAGFELTRIVPTGAEVSILEGRKR